MYTSIIFGRFTEWYHRRDSLALDIFITPHVSMCPLTIPGHSHPGADGTHLSSIFHLASSSGAVPHKEARVTKEEAMALRGGVRSRSHTHGQDSNSEHSPKEPCSRSGGSEKIRDL